MNRDELFERHLLISPALRARAKTLKPNERLVFGVWPELRPIDGDATLEPPDLPTTMEFDYTETRHALVRLMRWGQNE